MSGQYLVSISLNGYRLPYNPPDLQINYSSRESSEFVTSGDRTVLRDGGNTSGISAVRQTCSFTVLQWPKTPVYRSAHNQEHTNWLRSAMNETAEGIQPNKLSEPWVESGDYIEMLREAKERQSVVVVEIVESIRSLAGRDDVPETLRDGVLSHHRDTYLVDDLAIDISAIAGYLRTAKVTFRKYSPPSHIFGMLSGDAAKGKLWMTFTDAAQPDAGGSEYIEYTNSCALEWIYNLLEDHADPNDDPRTTYPPNLLAEGYYLGSTYSVGVESHADEKELPVSPGAAATETWGEATKRWFRDGANMIVYAAGKADSGLRWAEQKVTTLASYATPYVSVLTRVGLGIATGGWSELARVALMNHPWAGNVVENIAQEYNRTQNVLSSIGNGITYSILPPWVYSLFPTKTEEGAENDAEPFKWGLGFDPGVHKEFFDTVPAPQAAFETGTMVYERSPADQSRKV